MLDSERDGRILQVMLLMKNREYEILLEDADVRRIIESLAFEKS